MQLTSEQQEVVSIDRGRHLVLAPPGSGKTEMLSQRVLRALENGVDPSRMLCATFTNRAAFEMRSRIESARTGLVLPDVGNLHHFCHGFLRSVGKMPPTRRVLDDVEQLGFVKEVADVLRGELRTGASDGSKRTHGVTVIRAIRGMTCESSGNLHPPRVEYVRGIVEEYFAACEKAEKSPYPAILSAVLVAHQRRIGLPSRYLRPIPPELFELDAEGVVRALAGSYVALKRSFNSVDYDDLVNETYLYLEKTPLQEEKRFDWIQVDEVQDLNPLQWRIVHGLTSPRAVSVYFGDVEQAIFSFLGASDINFAEAVRGCERHYFKTNFRATPLLLEILMRYSLDALRSDWAFLPAPVEVNRANGRTEAFAEHGDAVTVSCVRRLIETVEADNVAILVRRNREADRLEENVKSLGFRYAKVSGIDLFSLAPMRDFLSFVAVVTDTASRTDWARLLRRFSAAVHTSAQARYLTREMYAARFEPMELWRMPSVIPALPHPGTRSLSWAWRRRQAIKSFRETLLPAVRKGRRLAEGRASYRVLFQLFAALALEDDGRYALRELWPPKGGPKDGTDEENFDRARRHAYERIEKFLRYTDSLYHEDSHPFREIVAADGARIKTLKEADLLVGDEKIVLSTVHKAKGRQFDAVVIPDVSDILAGNGGAEGEGERLLYVAMSRAKRHLLMFGWPEGGACGRLVSCFAPGYGGYYLRRSRHENLSSDWLCQWERLAALNAATDCRLEEVELALMTCRGPLVRMALKVLRHCADSEIRRRRYLAILQSGDSLPDDSLSTLIGCLGQCGIYDNDIVDAVRRAVLRSERDDVWDAALRYYQETTTKEQGRTSARESLADALYARSAELRVRAVRALADMGDGRWLRIVKGVGRDFDRMGYVAAPEHEAAIRRMIETAEQTGAKTHATRLRGIIMTRAKG